MAKGIVAHLEMTRLELCTRWLDYRQAWRDNPTDHRVTAEVVVGFALIIAMEAVSAERMGTPPIFWPDDLPAWRADVADAGERAAWRAMFKPS